MFSLVSNGTLASIFGAKVAKEFKENVGVIQSKIICIQLMPFSYNI